MPGVHNSGVRDLDPIEPWGPQRILCTIIEPLYVRVWWVLQGAFSVWFPLAPVLPVPSPDKLSAFIWFGSFEM